MSGRKRKKCDHCNEMLMEAVYKRHLDLYYNKDLNKWNKTTEHQLSYSTCLDLAASSSESEQEFENYSDPGNLTDGI